MNNITALAQSMKAAAEKAGCEQWQPKKNGPGEYGVMVKGSMVKRSGWSTHRPVCDEAVDKKTADFIAAANPANVLALVEALEAKEEMRANWSKMAQELGEKLDAAEKRIVELESCTVTAAASDVLAERQRQISMEGWTPEGDDRYTYAELSIAAQCYAAHSGVMGSGVPSQWPWDDEWWKPSGRRRNLIKAGALIIAEIERLDRAAGIQVIEGEGQ